MKRAVKSALTQTTFKYVNDPKSLWFLLNRWDFTKNKAALATTLIDKDIFNAYN